MLGIQNELIDSNWDEAIDWSIPVVTPSPSYEPLFKRLDVDEIVEEEKSLVEQSENSHDVTHSVKGGKKEKKTMKTEAPEGIEYLDFESFMKVELRVGKIVSVEDHPNADRLYVVKLDDGSDDGRTICAGIKKYYSVDELLDKNVVFVANLKPRPLRGVVSEGMMLAADDGNEAVRLVTIDGEIASGSLVR